MQTPLQGSLDAAQGVLTVRWLSPVPRSPPHLIIFLPEKGKGHVTMVLGCSVSSNLLNFCPRRCDIRTVKNRFWSQNLDIWHWWGV